MATGTIGIGNYFKSAPVNIRGNLELRIPQVGAYYRVNEHFRRSNEAAICVMPVGSGKSGTMGLLPYRLARGRVLIIAPNIEIKEGLIRNLSFDSRQDCFYISKDVLESSDCPETAELKADAAIHDTNEAHIVISNIQQLRSPRWADSFPEDYFDLVLVDEAHHAAAESWENAFQRFPKAKVVHLTGTPFRADGQEIPGVEVYRFKIVEAIINNYLKRPRYVEAQVEEITFSYKGERNTYSLKEVMEAREKTWFSKGCAMAPECNETIVDESISLLDNKRKSWPGHKIIAAACSITHAKDIVDLYNAKNVPAIMVHSNMTKEEVKENKAAFHRGDYSVMVQIDMLGEGYDHPPISIGAIFRPYRSLNAFIQFIGRSLRWVSDLSDEDNIAHIVTHPGLNVTRHWEGFKKLDKEDQELMEYIVGERTEEPSVLQQADEIRQRQPGAYMIVEDEVVKAFTDMPFLDEIEEAAVDALLFNAEELGFDINQLGLNREKLISSMKYQKQLERPAQSIRVRKQEERELAGKRLVTATRKAGSLILQRLGMTFDGDELVDLYPEEDEHTNIPIVMRLLNRKLKEKIGKNIPRKQWSLQQYETGLESLSEITEEVIQDLSSRIQV